MLTLPYNFIIISQGGDLEEIFEELERIGADDKVLKRIKVLEDSKLEHPGVKIMRKVVEGCMPL